MDWIQTFTIIGVISALTFFMVSKLDGDIKASNARMDQHMAAANSRTDQLYQMFVDLLKEGK